MKRTMMVLALGAGLAVQGVQAEPLMREVLSLQDAAAIRDACIAKGAQEAKDFAIAIYDHEARLVAFAKMDGASYGVAELAQWKGASAATYGTSSESTGKWNAPTAPHIATFPGGLPIYSQAGVLLGSVGVSGAAPQEDAACAQAGINAAGLASHKP